MTKDDRRQLVLDEETRKLAAALQSEEKRSFNNLVEWLIAQEWKRRHPVERQPVQEAAREVEA